MFLHLSVSHSVHRGACVVLGGRAWFLGGACVVFSGGGGGAWFFRVGHAWFFRGACMVFCGGGRGRGLCVWFFFGFSGCIGYNEIRSMSGRYASYWNAFLLPMFFVQSYQPPNSKSEPSPTNLNMVRSHLMKTKTKAKNVSM